MRTIMADERESPAALLLRGIMALGRRARAERPAGTLGLSGLGILGTLNRMGPLFATQLAVQERLKPQSLSRLLAELERCRMISRRRSTKDRRAVTIAVTARGRAALFMDIAARREWLEEAIRNQLTATEREVVADAAALMIRLATPQDTDTH
jgi:DNA-binding MarR family transcriptional regulator